MIDQASRDASIAFGLCELARRDAEIAAYLAKNSPPPARVAEPGLATLVRIIIGQQVSTKAAATVFGRLEQACANAVEAQRLMELGEAGLRQLGLSGRKTGYILSLAERVADSSVDIDNWQDFDDHEAIASISQLRGFGRWSAEIYLMFALGRQDVLPADDLAIRFGYAKLKALDLAPTAAQLRMLAEAWSPYRTAASHLLWRVYGAATLQA